MNENHKTSLISGIQRACFVVHDINEAIPRYEGITGVTLTKSGDAVSKAAGVVAAGAFDKGIELASPIPGSTNPAALHMKQFLEKHGESLYAVVYEVEDMESAVKRARDCGYEVLLGPFSLTQEEIDQELGGIFTRFEEVVMSSTRHEFLVTYNALAWKHE